VVCARRKALIKSIKLIVKGAMDKKDRMFASPMERVTDFDFGESTAEVFDNMLLRSVPFYEEIQHMIVDIACQFARDGAVVCDLGCSTGTTLRMLIWRLRKTDRSAHTVKLVGIDSSPAMLERAQKNLGEPHRDFQTNWELRDLNCGIEDVAADVFIMNLTLQFVRPFYREQLIKEIYQNTNRGGCLILVEKVLADDTLLGRLYIDMFHEFKVRKGYSELEISQKREALENVLIPYRVSENLQMLKNGGFARVEMFFRWFNFAGFIATKN
jgi:tRNA (cmo5U34)-methyltransferase